MVILIAVASACRTAVVPVHLQPEDKNVAILPPVNQTGSELIVSGGSWLEKYILQSERVTVPDVLAWEAQQVLSAHGWKVADSNDAPSANAADGVASTLSIVLRRFETDGTFQPAHVIVAVDVKLLAADDGRILWSADDPAHPIATPGAVSFGQAYVIAAQKVMREALAPLLGN